MREKKDAENTLHKEKYKKIYEELATKSIEAYKPQAELANILYLLECRLDYDYRKKPDLDFIKKTQERYEQVVKADERYRDKYRYFEAVATIYQDDYLKLDAVITDLDNKVNKFSLSVIGNCLFGGHGSDAKMLKCPYNYGSHIIEGNGYFSVNSFIRKGKTAEELRAYAQKNKDKFLKDFIKEYLTVKEKYLGVNLGYKLEEFKDLVMIHKENLTIKLKEDVEHGNPNSDYYKGFISYGEFKKTIGR